MKLYAVAAVLSTALMTGSAFATDLPMFAPPAADAPSRAYATVFGGVVSTDLEFGFTGEVVPGGSLVQGERLNFDAGYMLGGALGAEVLPNLRGELEFSVSRSSLSVGEPGDAETVDLTSYTAMANAWYDVGTFGNLTPYIGGGVGYGYSALDGGFVDGEDVSVNGIVYQLGFGARYAATDQISIDVGYRYKVMPDGDISEFTGAPEGGTIYSRSETHTLQGGVSFNF